MAQFSNSVKDKRLAKTFKERLEQLQCPFTEGVEDTWISELLFRPGEARIQLLQWLFSKFDSHLSEVVDPQYSGSDSKMDSCLQRLLFAASTLGLCTADDIELIRGSCPFGKQAAFMDQLLDLVCIVDSAEDPHKQIMQSPGYIGEATGLEDQFISDCQFVDTLVEQEHMESLFQSEAKLLPPDLTKMVEARWETKGYRDKDNDRLPVPDLTKIAESAKELNKDLERQIDMLNELKKNHNYPEPDTQAVAKVQRTLKLVLSELSQLVVGFTYCFENEMRQWCNKTPPTLTELGPTFKRTHTLLQQFIMLLESLGSIRLSYNHLCSDMKSSIRTVSQGDAKLGSAVKNVIETFQECVNVLEESIAREESRANSTLSTSFSASIVKVD